MPSQLPPPRRVVTGHDAENNSVYLADAHLPTEPVGDGTVGFSVLYETHQFPADNGDWVDPMLSRTMSLANTDGVVLRVVDFLPNNLALFHRTESLDFGIINFGEIICRLDNGVEKTFRAGDICIQRSTIHSWENRTNEPCRITFVLIAAKPLKGLETAGFTAKDMASGGKEEAQEEDTT